MKKWVFSVTLILVLFLVIYFYFFNSETVINRSVKEVANSELNTKVFYSSNQSRKVSTDFDLYGKSPDSVYSIVNSACTINKFPLQYFTISAGDGFSGIQLKIYNLLGRNNIKLEQYSDNLNSKLPKYKILEQKLILDKYNYDQGDSIFGRIELKIVGETGSLYTPKFFFRTKISD
jgi:hypothetical protein